MKEAFSLSQLPTLRTMWSSCRTYNTATLMDHQKSGSLKLAWHSPRTSRWYSFRKILIHLRYFFKDLLLTLKLECFNVSCIILKKKSNLNTVGASRKSLSGCSVQVRFQENLLRDILECRTILFH